MYDIYIHGFSSRSTLFIIVSAEFIARDAFVRTNRRAVAMMSVHLSVCLERACIVIIQCTLARI